MKTLNLVAAALASFGLSTAASAQSVSNDGSLSYSFSFPLPAARGKYQPALALNYNSNLGSSNYGVGWSLTSNYVDASTRATPTPSGGQRTRYTLVMDGAPKLLVQAPDGSYRPDVSSAFFSLTQSSSGWQGTDGAGNTFVYACVASTACDRWYLTRVIDWDGNQTTFDYAAETHSCPSVGTTTGLLTNISYNYTGSGGTGTAIHQVALTYEAAASNAELEAVGGCIVVHDQRLKTVSIARDAGTSPATTLSIGSWSATYSPSPDTNRDRMDSIQAFDRAGAAFGLPVSFTYETNQTGANLAAFDPPATVTFGTPSPPDLVNLSSSQGLDWAGSGSSITDAAAFIDMDGDGLPDMVWGGFDEGYRSCPTCALTTNSGIRWARNLSNGSGVPTFAPIAIIANSQSWTGIISALNGDGSGKGYQGTNQNALKALGPAAAAPTLLLDFNGDGVPDLVTGGCGGAVASVSVQFGGIDPSSHALSYSNPQCVDASNPYTMLQTLYQQPLGPTDPLPLVYIDWGPMAFPGAERPMNTWAQLIDVTGDGVADYVLVNKTTGVWNVFPGYRTGPNGGAWAFGPAQPFQALTPIALPVPAPGTPTNAYPIRTVLGAMDTDTYNNGAYDFSALMPGKTIVDFRDMNGDGLPDRVVAVLWQEHVGTVTYEYYSWYVDYNTGMGFAQISNRSLPTGMYQKSSPFQNGNWISTRDTALVDLNRDGRPDFVSRYALGASNMGTFYNGPACATTTVESLQVWFNAAAGLGFDPIPIAFNAPCFPDPTAEGFVRPFDTFFGTDTSMTKAFNEGFYDLNGDGIMDYVRASGDAEASPGRNNWAWYRGRQQSRRSDILVSIASSTGLVQNVHWAPSSGYGVWPGIPYVSDVVSSIDRTGPATAPLTLTYTYGNLQIVPRWDDPTGAQMESLGFTQVVQTPSGGGLISETDFGSTHDTAGTPIATCQGVTAWPCAIYSATSPNVDISATTWSASSIGSTVVGAAPVSKTFSYPAYLYPSASSRVHSELSVSPIATKTSSPPDAYGNITSFSTVGDALSSASTTVNVNRVFATGPGSHCVSCMVEETVTNPNAASDPVLAHSFYHYDLPSGSTSNGRDQTSVALGHLSYVESLASTSGSTGPYEVPQITYYDARGNISNVVKSYAGQLISTLTGSLNYQPDGLAIASSVSSDGTNSLSAYYSYNAYGDLTQVANAATVGQFTEVIARAYDNAGRVIAESDRPISGTTVASPVRAYEYVLPAMSLVAGVKTYSLAAMKTYTFASQASAFTVGAVPSTDDSTQVIVYLNALGQSVQTRARLGSGTAPGSTAGNVLKSLPAQYQVRSNVVFDGLGRITAALEPYFATTGDYVDPSSGTATALLELSTPGLHAMVTAYDSRSRPICAMYEPVVGAIAPAPATVAACHSNSSEGPAYGRSTQTAYGVDSSLGRPYLTVDTVASWASAGSTPSRIYLDSMGRVQYARTPSGTVEQTNYDSLGRRLSVIRTPAGGTTPIVSSSWSYDKRGRLSTEFADASGYRSYSYLPTGDTVQVLRNPAAGASTADPKSVWSVRKIGSLGRVVEVDDFRYEVPANCSASAAHQDITTFQYDVPLSNSPFQSDPNNPRYQFTLGRLTAATTATTTVAFGYNSMGMPTIRDEFDGASWHSLADSRGADGRLLSRAITSPYLAGFNPASTFGYAIGYDSSGNPVQVSATYDSAGTFHPITAAAASSAYWLAGTGSAGSEPATGPFDALGRLTSEKWDGGQVTKSAAYLLYSNLLTGASTTLSASGLNVYSVQSMTWQGTLLSGYNVTSNWDGGGTAHAAAYDADAHLLEWSATALASINSATQQFNEGFTFNLENLKSVNATNSIGVTVASTYNYADPASAERVTSISSPSSPVTDTYVYDRRGRGLVVQHKLNATQSPAQDSYEYDSRDRLISIAHLGEQQEMLDYDAIGDLVSRRFPAGSTDLARYYVGDDLTLVSHDATTKTGLVHIRIGQQRIASFWSKTAGATSTNGVIYYHRDRRGDVIATTTNGGVMGLSYRYLPSGAIDKVVNAAGSIITPGSEPDSAASDLGFTGGLRLSDGLIHLKARAYSPALRRFLQPDTVDMRRYTYAQGDPLNFSDPSGREATPDNGVSTIPSVFDGNRTEVNSAILVAQPQPPVFNGADYGPPAPALIKEDIVPIPAREMEIVTADMLQITRSELAGGALAATPVYATPIQVGDGVGLPASPARGSTFSRPSLFHRVVGFAMGNLLGGGAVQEAVGLIYLFSNAVQLGAGNVSIRNNGIVIEKAPIQRAFGGINSAITFGHFMILAGDADYKRVENNYTTIEHEEQHTYQSEALGVIYLPEAGLGLLFSYIVEGDSHGPHSPLERGPQSDPPHPWP